MNTDLHKRLEEAADIYAKRIWENLLEVHISKTDFLAGAEYGFKEAIKQVGEWLKEHSNTEYYSDGASYCDTPFATQEDMLDTFDFDMNKLLEET